MNILQILPELNVGGVETGTVDLAGYLLKHGHKVVVVSNGGPLVKDLHAMGAAHYSLPAHNKSIVSIIRTVPRLARIIRQEEIQIVHARSRVPAWIAYFACRSTGAVFITTCHGYYSRHPFSRVMAWAKRVIAISNVIARHMIDDFGVPHDRIRLIPRSVDIGRFTYRDPDETRGGKFHVGIVGRMTPLKGHVYFIKAMALLSRSIPGLKVWVVGDAPASRAAYKEEVQLLTRRLGLWQSVEFLGTQKNIPEIMSHLDAVVLPTVTHEAFGRVVVEAQASGVPVVATKVGGVVDIIEDGVTGFLVPPADPDAIACAVQKIYDDPAGARQIAARAYEKVRLLYTVERMGEKTLEVYREALADSSILIIKLSSLGDIILSTAALKAIRGKFGPGYRISVLVSEEFKDLLLRCPYIDELLVVNLKEKDTGPAGLMRVGAMLRRKGFDVIVDLQNNRASHALAFLSRALHRYGYDNKKWGRLLNHRIRDEKGMLDPLAHQFRILAMLGIEAGSTGLELWPSEDDQRYVDGLLSEEWLSAKQRLVGINISASRRWATKSLPLVNLGKVCQELGGRDIRIVLAGTPDDRGAAQELIAQAKNVKFINMCGKTTVNQLACLIRRCSVLVSGDSAPLHVAAAVGTPFVALFGPTDPRRHLPPAKAYVLVRKEIPCSPCYKSKCRTKKCMALIRPEEVAAAVEKLLEKKHV